VWGKRQQQQQLASAKYENTTKKWKRFEKKKYLNDNRHDNIFLINTHKTHHDSGDGVSRKNSRKAKKKMIIV
jgi:hypothetical protein